MFPGSGQGLYLQTKNNRWKWMVGATAATAAGVTASQAGTITISLLNNNFFSGANHLNADLTGDGHPDLTIANASSAFGAAEVSLNGVQAFFRYSDTIYRFSARMDLGPRIAHYYAYRNGPVSLRSGTPSLIGSIPIFFKDLHINSGAPTRGSPEVTVGGAFVGLDSFTYTSTTLDQRVNSIPDQSSSLALLAMGAGGILALRRWRAEQGGS